MTVKWLRRGSALRQTRGFRSAKPLSAVRIRPSPPGEPLLTKGSFSWRKRSGPPRIEARSRACPAVRDTVQRRYDRHALAAGSRTVGDGAGSRPSTPPGAVGDAPAGERCAPRAEWLPVAADEVRSREPRRHRRSPHRGKTDRL